MRYWLYKTNRGRVVYDRKKHPFSWRDAARITRQIPFPQGDPETFVKEFYFLNQTLRNVLAQNVFMGLDALEEIWDAAGVVGAAAGGNPIGAVFKGVLNELFDFTQIIYRWWQKRS